MRFSVRAAAVLILGIFSVADATAAEALSDRLATRTNFDIPAQPLEISLKQLATQAGIQILFEDQVVRGLQAPAIKANQSALQALSTLLNETGLEYAAKNETVAVRKKSTKSAPLAALGEQGQGEEDGRLRLAQADTTQSDPSAPSDSSSTDTKAPAALEEIVVTAQKREEKLSDVPISISAYGPEEMDRRGIRDLADVAFVTPGLRFFNPDGVVNTISIRGIASQAGAGTTAVYLDDIPLQTRTAAPTFSTSNLKTFDLERVEVLRGPQGTLFGAGAQGGAVRFITPQPSMTDRSGYARAETFNTRGGGTGHEVGLAVGGPIVEGKLGFRVSGWHRRDGGYIDHYSPLPGGARTENADGSDTYVTRAALSFAPVDWLTITPSLYVQDVKTQDVRGYDASASDPDDSRFILADLLLAPGRDKFYVPSLRVQADVHGLTFTSITSFLDRDYTQHIDYTNIIRRAFGGADATSADQYQADIHGTKQTNFVQELRVDSADPTAKLRWTVGAYYSLARQTGTQTIEAPGFPQFILDTFGVPIETVFGAGLIDNTFSFRQKQYNRDEQLAGFVNAEYELGKGFSVAAGTRVSRERNSFTFQGDGALQGGPTASAGEASETAVTPKLSLNYRPNSDNLFYLSAAKGYRPGGPNSQIAISTDACRAALAQVGGGFGSSLAYTADEVWNYELGSKNSFLDDRLHVNASVFHIRWKDTQQNIYLPDCLRNVIANLGSAESEGFDLTLDAKFTDHLLLNLSVGYTSAEISETATVSGTTYFNEGDQVFDIAPWTITAALQYDVNIMPETAGYFRLENSYSSKNEGPFANPFTIAADSRNELNLRIGAQWGNFDVSAFASNVLDAHPVVVVGQGGFPTVTIRPRTFGLTGIYRW